MNPRGKGKKRLTTGTIDDFAGVCAVAVVDVLAEVALAVHSNANASVRTRREIVGVTSPNRIQVADQAAARQRNAKVRDIVHENRKLWKTNLKVFVLRNGDAAIELEPVLNLGDSGKRKQKNSCRRNRPAHNCSHRCNLSTKLDWVSQKLTGSGNPWVGCVSRSLFNFRTKAK